MSEQLQHLIEKIRTEGVAKADAEAKTILDRARTEAARLEREAADKAAHIIKKAEADSVAYAERGRRALEQASRDTILTLQQSIETLFERVLLTKVEDAFSPESFRSFLQDVIRAYLAQGHKAGNLQVSVPANEADSLRAYILKALHDAAVEGLVIRSSNDVVKGFKVMLKDNHVEHDFTAEAVAETMARFVRPDLAALLRNAAAAPKDAPRGS
jgi:V/A-type H+-transporting ATPase subunit E